MSNEQSSKHFFYYLFNCFISMSSRNRNSNKKITGCDYFIINAPTGYVVAEWYGGYEPFKGEKVIGAFQNYGMITLFYGVSNQDGQVWLEDWGLSYENALEIMSEKFN
jgi:hypothetical protein